MKLLMIGDVMGKPGRQAVSELLPELRGELQLDLVIANGENAAAGRGLTEATAQQLFDAGVDAITSGNHIFDQKEIMDVLDRETAILRPINYPPGAPGRGMLTQKGITILNLQGRTFMPQIDCPFRAADAALAGLPEDAVIVVDMHCEATSEKLAMGRYLDGRVAAVMGTHTHVPTADEQILPKGTGYITDVGMCGVKDSSIGVDKDIMIEELLTQVPQKKEIAEGAVEIGAVLFDIGKDGKCKKVKRIREVVD